MLDFARQHPRATQLERLDISLNQTPSKDWLPSNIIFSRQNIFEEPPEDLVDKYNIIHVRYLTLVIKQNDHTTVLDNLLKMLGTFPSPSGPCTNLTNGHPLLSLSSILTPLNHPQSLAAICNGEDLIFEIE